jgi:integrase
MKLSETNTPGIWVRHYQSGRSRFGYTVVYGGRTYRRVSRINTLRGAAAERNKALERLASGQPVDFRPEARPYSITEAVTAYLEACNGLRSYPTMKLHKRDIVEFFGDLPVASLSQVAIAGFRRHRSEKSKRKPLSVATVNRALSFLRAGLNHAKGERKITGEHYFDRLSKADRKKVFLEEAPSAGLRRVSDANFNAVVAHLPPPYRPIAGLLLATATRKGEILGLQWGEVRGRGLYLRRTKSGKPRSVPLSSEAFALLPKRPKDAADDELVFRGRDGGDLRNNFDRAWRAARGAEGADLPWFRVHDLRHEAAARFLEAGGTPRELQVLGGWSSLELVERYTKVDQERIMATLAKIALPVGEYAVTAPTAKAKRRRAAKALSLRGYVAPPAG